MVSHLVDEDTGNRTLEEEIGSVYEGPAASERVQMATVMNWHFSRSFSPYFS